MTAELYKKITRWASLVEKDHPDVARELRNEVKPYEDRREQDLESAATVSDILEQISAEFQLSSKYDNRTKAMVQLSAPLKVDAKGTLSETLARFDGCTRVLVSIEEGMIWLEAFPTK